MTELGYDVKAWEKQRQWLAAYEELGQISRACEQIGIHINTYNAWVKSNSNGFREMTEQATGVFREKMEKRWLFDVLNDDPKVAPILRIFALKGIWREKYGDTPAVTDETVGDTLRALADLSKAGTKERPPDDQKTSTERAFLESLAGDKTIPVEEGS